MLCRMVVTDNTSKQTWGVHYCSTYHVHVASISGCMLSHPLHCSMSHVYIVLCHMSTLFYVTCLHCSMSHVYIVLCHMSTLFYVTCLHCSMSHVYTVLCHMPTLSDWHKCLRLIKWFGLVFRSYAYNSCLGPYITQKCAE